MDSKLVGDDDKDDHWKVELSEDAINDNGGKFNKQERKHSLGSNNYDSSEEIHNGWSDSDD